MKDAIEAVTLYVAGAHELNSLERALYMAKLHAAQGKALGMHDFAAVWDSWVDYLEAEKHEEMTEIADVPLPPTEGGADAE